MAMQTNVPNPVKDVQLAVQGGGAKIILIMAALEAVENLRNQNQLRVTRIAGTSAGAIAGCIFAAGIPMAVAKAKFVAKFRDSFHLYFPPPNYWYSWNKFVRHLPLWSTTPLRKFLEDLFEEYKISTFEDIHKKTGTRAIVVASDLGTSKKVVYQSDEQHVVPALLDSCAIPYCFRVWNTSDNPVIVDGGICENLPSEELEQGEAQYGPLAAISFPHPRGNPPTSFREFTKAILNTAIDHSVSRARLRLGEDKVFSISTRSDIGTFDFDRALEIAESDTYTLIRTNSEAFFTKFIAPKKVHAVAGDPWRDQNISMMERLGLIYNYQHLNSKLEYLHCRFVVQANCLVQDKESRWFDAGDLLRYSVVFKTRAIPIFCQRFSVFQDENPTSLERMEFSVFDRTDGTNRPVDTTSLPVRDPQFPNKRPLLLFFLPQLPANSGPYTVEFKDEVKEFMSPLKAGKKDELTIGPTRAEGKIGRIDLVLHLPREKGFEKARMINKPGEVIGRPMDNGELADAYPTPLGFRTLGWTIENTDPKHVGVDIVV